MSGPPQFPPGWYPEGAHLRWWDGANWGPYAPATPTGPPQSEEERGRTMAVVSHLGFIAGGFILPVWLYEEIRRRPTLPGTLVPSTIGAERLNFRVRDGNGCDPLAIATEISCQLAPVPGRRNAKHARRTGALRTS